MLRSLFTITVFIATITWLTCCTGSDKLDLDKWTYIQVDNKRTQYDGRPPGSGYWFGLDMDDLTGDGYLDIVSGKWFYRNPGGDMEKVWHRVAFPDSMDALLIVDVDGDEFGDVIAAKCNEQYWLEATDREGTAWRVTQIGTLPICNHGTSTQGYNTAQIVAGGKPEILLHGGGTIYYFMIPDDPSVVPWPSVTVIEEGGNGEWLGTGDVNGDGHIDITAGFFVDGDRDNPNNAVVWLENPGDGSGNWTKHEIGITNFRADKVIPADMNGNGRLDMVVAEERWPGLEPDASLYWFEAPPDPASGNWKRHTIVTQYSMNNLDVADMNQNGYMDIITCEHKGPNEKLQIWVNDGEGQFTEHLIDQGKESHLGARVADMDGDGDLDIISIAWDDYQYLHLWRNDAIKGTVASGTVKSIPLGMELTGDLKYRVPVEVAAEGFERYDKHVEVELDFTELLQQLGSTTPFDAASIRVVEVDVSGNIIDETLPFQFNKSEDYDASQHAKGTLVFIMDGTTSAGATRYFHVLFGESGGYFVQPVFQRLVTFDDHIERGGYRSFRAVTNNATYYYHKQGSGFTSMVDLDDNDWISYRPEGGPKGNFRGIPNIAPAGFHPGPGENNKVSRILHNGPVQLKIYSETKDERWAKVWSIFPNYATMTLLRKGDEPYWILYEGTPGGEFDLNDYGINSAGEHFALPEYTNDNKWNGDLPAPEWVYFGDANLNRVLYLIRHEYSDAVDEYWHFDEGGMTVFGFGRGPRDEQWQRLTDVPTHLTIGFADDTTHATVTRIIESAYRDLQIFIGEPETSIDRNPPEGS